MHCSKIQTCLRRLLWREGRLVHNIEWNSQKSGIMLGRAKSSSHVCGRS